MRIAVCGVEFKAVYFSTIAEFEDLELTVVRAPGDDPIFTVVPEAVASPLGMQIAYITFEEPGQYLLRWESVEEGVDLYEDVTVLAHDTDAEVHGVVHAIGTEFYGDFVSLDEGLDVSVAYFYPDLTSHAADLQEVKPGRYRLSSPVVLTDPGVYLFTYYDQDTFIGYTVYDLFNPANYRSVIIAVRDGAGSQCPGIWVTMTSASESEDVHHAVTDAQGKAYFTLPDGRYYVTLRNRYYPDRVYSTNNFPFEVVDPSTRNSGNMVVYGDLSWLDVDPIDPVRIPTDKRSRMSVSLRRGPEGVAPQFRRFVVEMLDTRRLSGLMVTKGEKFYYLDQSGHAVVPLIRGSRVRVAFPDADLHVTFTVPEQEAFDLADIQGSDPFTVTLARVSTPYRTSP